METPQFKPGTTPGEAAWLIARCVQALAPAAPNIFGRQTLAGQVQLDVNAWLGAACGMALQIQEQAFRMTQDDQGGEIPFLGDDGRNH